MRKDDLKKFLNNKNKEPIAIAAIMAVFFVCTALVISEQIESNPIQLENDNDSDLLADAAAGLKFQRPKSLLKDISKGDEDEVFVPGPDKLNMAYYYADDANTDDAINSYAGKVYQELSSKNANYMASFYDLTDVTPLKMAQRLGIDSSRVLGKYNPTDSSHDPGNSSTWTVNSFKNVSVNFYDGDGKRINGYYAVQEIMSLASVYMYYHDNYNVEDFSKYCNSLFETAITSKVSLGSVYYCSGCLNKTTQQESTEALAMEAQALAQENKLSLQTALSSGLNPGTVEAVKDNASNAVSNQSTTIEQIFDFGSEADSYVNYYQETSQAAPTETSSESVQETIETTTTPPETASAATTAAQPAQTQFEEIIDSNTPPAVLGESYYAPEYKLAEETSADTAVVNGKRFGGSDELLYIEETTADSSSATQGVAVYNSSVTQPAKAFVDENGNIVYADSLSTPESSSSSVNAQNNSTGTAVDSQATETAEQIEQNAVAQRINALLQQANIQATADSYCPGHVDIYVTIKIRGIDDKNGLFAVDKIGNDPANFNDKWQGWTEERIAEAKALNSQDWLEEYGLSISSINLENPLNAEEIQKYLDTLPADVSELRRKVIEFALNSVGKIPYYWGGKPAGAGYSSNRFGTLIGPDTRGRILKGLDCSGWINWIYWSVTGRSLAGQSTGTLVGCGRKISRGDLKPGDIIIRVGDDAHVVMFLYWAGDGDFYAIHETGDVINNVTVSKMTANWPYYRSLAD